MQQENLFVGMFDILGFSKLVMEQPFMEALRKLESLVRLARWSATVPVLGPAALLTKRCVRPFQRHAPLLRPRRPARRRFIPQRLRRATRARIRS